MKGAGKLLSDMAISVPENDSAYRDIRDDGRPAEYIAG